MVVRCKSLQQGVNFMFASLLALQKEKEKTITKPHTHSAKWKLSLKIKGLN